MTPDPDRYVHLFQPTDSFTRDAGLVLSSYIASIPPAARSQRPPPPLPRLPIFERALSQPNLNIIELGAGCGIVGVTLLHHVPTISQLLLTDLPEASEILTMNLSPGALRHPRPAKLSHLVLDWSLPLPPPVAATRWDLVLVADCTYNPDVVPDLVKTLSRLASGGAVGGGGGDRREVMVVLAMKVRHESEMVFFDLMREAGFGIRERCVVPLGWEEIEIYVFALEGSRGRAA